MIVGEAQLIGQYHNEEYDLFFKKIRKKIKQKVKRINPLRGFNPLRGGIGSGIVKKLRNKPSPSPQPKMNVQTQANKAVEAKEIQLATDRHDLMKEMAAFEEKKVQEITQLDEEKVKTEQEKIDVEQGEDKRILYIGLAGLGVLIVVGGIIVFIKSRQNKLAALNHQ